MGLFSFVKDAGRKVGLFGGQEAAEREDRSAANARREASPEDPNEAFARKVAADIRALGLDVTDLRVTYAPFKVTLHGKAATTADAEKAVLTAGNSQGVAEVDDQLEVLNPEPPAVYHTVKPGDTLSKISLAQYGVIHLYDAIFEANQPMIKHVDEIFPGQVLRIPQVEPPIHTVVRGETLGSIAKYWFGDPRQYTAIFEANRDTLSDPDAIEVGQALRIPIRQPASQA